METRLAVLADVHGNSWALRAVLRDMAERGVEDAINLGDSLYGPLDPGGCADLLMSGDMKSIMGNQDRLILEGDAGNNPTLDMVRRSLAPEQMAWLEARPSFLVLLDELYCCHGSPRSDEEYLLEEVSSGRAELKSCSELVHVLDGVDCPVILCGHTHLPRVEECGERLLVNPGSVGLPAYEDDSPPHAMENGSPHARYAVVERGREGWKAGIVEVEYDWRAAARAARENGRTDWERWLSTGKA